MDTKELVGMPLNGGKGTILDMDGWTVTSLDHESREAVLTKEGEESRIPLDQDQFTGMLRGSHTVLRCEIEGEVLFHCFDMSGWSMIRLSAG